MHNIYEAIIIVFYTFKVYQSQAHRTRRNDPPPHTHTHLILFHYFITQDGKIWSWFPQNKSGRKANKDEKFPLNIGFLIIC